MSWLAVTFVTVVLLVLLAGNQPDEERDPFDERPPPGFWERLPQLEEVVMIVGAAIMIVAIASGAA